MGVARPEVAWLDVHGWVMCILFFHILNPDGGLDVLFSQAGAHNRIINLI